MSALPPKVVLSASAAAAENAAAEDARAENEPTAATGPLPFPRVDVSPPAATPPPLGFFAAVWSSKLLLVRYAGLAVILVATIGVTVGYLGYADAKARAATPEVTVRAGVAKGAPTGAAGGGSAKSPAAPRKVLITTIRKPRLDGWRRMIGWSAAGVLVGAAAVGVSLHERLPRRKPSGADEMLNEPVPF